MKTLLISQLCWVGAVCVLGAVWGWLLFYYHPVYLPWLLLIGKKNFRRFRKVDLILSIIGTVLFLLMTGLFFALAHPHSTYFLFFTTFFFTLFWWLFGISK